MPRTVIVSGGFDPLHSGHIAYLQAAAALGDSVEIGVGSWHCLYNPGTTPLRVVEIQYGERCVEEDIERAVSHLPEDLNSG